MAKRWIVEEPASDSWIAECAPLSRPAAQLLWNRGIQSAAEIESFFNPNFEDHVHDPFLFSQMRDAVGRVFEAIDRGEKITVFGDYDADGLTGSTVLLSVLREIGGERLHLDSYIPHRDKEGYGLQTESAEHLADMGAHLVITVDCGIACVPEIKLLRDRGVDVVVVDHHQFGEELPDAMLIHPSIPNEPYPFKHLAAVGVAWKFACALIAEARDRGIDVPNGAEKWLLDLVAIATVTDMVPLVGENRVLEYYGLKVLNKSRRHGLRALAASGNLRFGEITARDIGFVIGPRLNATSRMEHAEIALRLLTSETEDGAWSIAQEIERLNRSRQDAMKRMMNQAESMMESEDSSSHLHLLYRNDWSPALVGLVAGRFSDSLGKPVLAVGKYGSQWIGSGRSQPWYDITDAVRESGEDLLTRSGGHTQACGFALRRDHDVPRFRERVMEHAAEHLSKDQLGPYLTIDAELMLHEITWPLLNELERFAPFGQGNPEPLFLSRNVEVMSFATMGAGDKHLKIIGRDGHTIQKFVGFSMGNLAKDLRDGASIDLVYTLGVNSWNGSREIQCKLMDVNLEPNELRIVTTSASSESLEDSAPIVDRLAEVGLV